MGGSASTDNREGNQALVTAVVSNNITAAQLALRSQNASPNAEVPEELFASFSRERSQGNTVLHACMYRSTNILIELLESGADVNARNSRFETPLHLAAELGKSHSVKLLLEKGSKTEDVDFLNRTALHRAVISDQVQVLDTLNSNTIDLNARDDYGSTPLHYAVAFGSLNAIKWLLARGANLSLKNSWKQTPGELAFTLGYNKNAVDLISGQSTQVEFFVKIPQHVEITRALWKRLPGRLRDRSLGPNTLTKEVSREVWGHDVRRNTLLHLAAARSHPSQMQELLNLQANPTTMNSRGETPLHISAQLGEDSCCKDLLQYNRSLVDAVDHLGQTPLHKAVVGGKFSTLDLLGHFGADIDAPDNEGRTPLHLAVLLERRGIIRWLRSKGASLTSRTERGKTAVDLAESLKWPSELIAFLKHEEDPNNLHDSLEASNVPQYGLLQAVVLEDAKTANDRLHAGDANLKDTVPKDMPNLRAHWTTEGNQLLHLAALTSSFFVKKVIECGGDVREKNASGEVPLHLAADAGMHRCVELLLDKGCADFGDNSGRTPLHRAVMNNHILTLEVLKEYKVDLNATDEHGSTPLHYAVAYGCPEAVQWLLENKVDLTRQNSWGQTPRDLAMYLGYDSYLVELVACPTSSKTTENTIKVPVFVELLKAVWQGQLNFSQDIRCCKAFLNEEVPLELWGDDVRGNTPLHYAAAHRQHALVQELLTLGAFPDAQNSRGETPLHLSAQFGRDGSCRVLVRHHQALVFVRDGLGHLPLHKAVMRGQRSTLDILKQGQCDIDAKDNEGKTALHIAVLLAREDVVKWFIENRANTSMKTGSGHRASQLAEKAGNMSMAKMLRESESFPSAPVYLHAEESRAPIYHSLTGREKLNLPD